MGQFGLPGTSFIFDKSFTDIKIDEQCMTNLLGIEYLTFDEKKTLSSNDSPPKEEGLLLPKVEPVQIEIKLFKKTVRLQKEYTFESGLFKPIDPNKKKDKKKIKINVDAKPFKPQSKLDFDSQIDERQQQLVAGCIGSLGILDDSSEINKEN